MNIVFDSGAVRALAREAAKLMALRDHGWWPPTVPAPVLTACLTGDHRRDYHANRLLRTCVVEPTDEITARHAARMRAAVGRSRRISATDAMVAAAAVHAQASAVVTSNLGDLTALLASSPTVAVVQV